MYLTHRLRFYVDFIFPQTFYKLAESRPAKTDKMPLYKYTALGVYYPCITMAIQRGNVSSRAEYYVFRKFLVRDIPKAVRERKKK